MKLNAFSFLLLYLQLSGSYENMETEHMSQHGEHMMSSYLGTPLSVDELSRQPSSVSSDFPGTPSELSSPISQWQPMYISGQTYHHKNNDTNGSQVSYDDYHNHDSSNINTHDNNLINKFYHKNTTNNSSLKGRNNSEDNKNININLNPKDTSIHENASTTASTGDSGGCIIRRSTRTSRNKNPVYTDTPLTRINLTKTTNTIVKKKNNGHKNDNNSHNTCNKHGVLYCPQQQQQQQQHLRCKHHPSHHQHPHYIHHHHHHNHNHYHPGYHHQHHHHFHHHQHRSALRQKKGIGLRNRRGIIRAGSMPTRAT